MTNAESNRPWSNKIKEKVKNANEKDIIKYFEDLSDKWTIRNKNNILEDSCIKLNINNLDEIDLSILQTELEKAIFEANKFINSLIKK